MIPRILQAELIKEDMWLIWFHDPNEPRFPIIRVVPVDENPTTCPGGEIWCKQFGCVPGDNIFTRSEPELIIEEGAKIPDDWEAPWDSDECEWCGLNRDCYQCDPDFYDEDLECSAGCEPGMHMGCDQEV